MENISNRQHVKNKFKTEGVKPFLDQEVLELLLTYSVPVKDTKQLACDLFKNFGSLNNIFDASYTNLQKTNGLDSQSAILINIVRELITRYSYDKVKTRKSIHSKEDFYNYCLTHLQNKKQEYFEVLFLDKKSRLIAAEVLVEGNIDSATVSPRKLLELLIKHKPQYIICVHNHPSGDPTPSTEDKEMTENLQVVLEAMSVKMLDHIIIGAGKIYSLASKSYIEKPKILL